ncbi:MAG: hypothetical protein HDT02_00390 [Bacteroidales bacterium]|nr:hypothetical protein [Bacteroidales bacterium]
MKTSFYFVLWILIYPILGLFNNDFIDNNAFIVALAAVWGLSWLLNRLMPETLTYERVSQIAPILEDVYTGNVASFGKRLTQESTIELVTAIYFVISTIVIGIVVFIAGINDWIALIIFGFFAFGAISSTISLMRAKSSLNENPTGEQCMEIATETYKLDYESYYEQRQEVSYNEMWPPRPRHFIVFQIFSIIIAVIAALLGLFYITTAIFIILGSFSLEAGAFAGMYFLYGSLATYFGIKDIITISKYFKAKKSLLTEDK